MLTRNMDVEKSSSKDEITVVNEISSQEDENISSNEVASNNIQDLSPSISNTAVAERAHEENPDDDEPDETLTERLLGLTEMFPEPVRDYACKITDLTKQGVCKLYSFSRSAAWVVISSAVILFAPPIFESERANLKELQMSQEKQVLLGPSVALGTKSAKVRN